MREFLKKPNSNPAPLLDGEHQSDPKPYVRNGFCYTNRIIAEYRYREIDQSPVSLLPGKPCMVLPIEDHPHIWVKLFYNVEGDRYLSKKKRNHLEL
jgi:hypothetical protein